MSPRVGTGHVAILPVLTGFKRSVSNEMKSAGTQGARDFESSMKGAGSKSGKQLGSDLKSAFNTSAKDLAGPGLKVLQRDVATASASLSRARLKQQDEAGRVRVAEAKLAEAVAKHGESSSQAIAASERLESARRREAAANDTVKAASERLSTAQKTLADVTHDAGNEAPKAQSKFAAFLETVKGEAADAGRSLKDNLTQGLTKAADMMSGPATAAVAGFAAFSGVALTKGFGRLSSIDTASKKLTGLGNDGETVGKIMTNATASVKGTAFGLGEAANVAASAVAAQIKPGQQLETHLKRVANNAAAAGVGMEDMGAIFNKAATQANGVQNDVIGQLADKGIPIYAALGEQMGVTAGEVFKLASEGKVDFETFSKAAEAAAGTVAEEMGKTVPGALSNLWASVGRIGANVLGGIDKETGEMFGLYAKIGPLIASITSALGPVEDMASRLGEVLSAKVGPILEKITDFFNRMGESSGGLTGKLGPLMSALAPILGMTATLGSSGLAGLLSKIPVVGELFGGLAGKMKFLSGPLGLIIGLVGGLAAADPQAMVSGMMSMVDGVTSALEGLIPQLVGVISKVVPKLVSNLLANIPTLLQGAIQLFMVLLDAVVQIVPPLLQMIVELVPQIITALIGMIPVLIEGAIELFLALVQAVAEILPVLIQAIVDLIPVLIVALIELIPQLLIGAIQLFMALVQGVAEILPALIEAIVMLIPQIVQAIVDAWPQILEAGKTMFAGMSDAVGESWDKLLESLTGMKDRIVGFFSGAWEWLKDAGKSIIDGLAQGIRNGIDNAVEAISDAVGAVREWLPFSPAKKGPFSGTGYTTYSGKALMRDWAGGITDEIPVAESAVASAMARAQEAVTAVQGAFSVSATADGSAAGSGQPGNSVAINNYGVDAAELGARTYAQFQHWINDQVRTFHA
ncbi:tape measure protein [Actinomycetaceae bacterium MB13-C1-2]|nr:tape measure protein [Actinomycetaceae bacterium MB13-C1-2]